MGTVEDGVEVEGEVTAQGQVKVEDEGESGN